MSKFDKVIGYEAIKNELLQICDMVKNKEVYDNLGATLPNGVLLYGEPGLGKTLMAKCFIEECGLKTFTIRKNKSENFVEHIAETFKEAKKNAPAVVFLDDMDKFANEDNSHRDAEEYVAVQAGIDDAKDFDVFVIATVNEYDKLPCSLTRAGRFDRSLEVAVPSKEDSKKIIAHYLSGKKIAENVNIDDVSKMIFYRSCAELEKIMNEAAVSAGYKRKAFIEMSDIVNAVLKIEYKSPDDIIKMPDTELEKLAYHEAGHLVVSEILCTGSVGLASVRNNEKGLKGGFVRRCKKLMDTKSRVLVSLAGKAASELKFGVCADGCESDIRMAYECVRDAISELGGMGFALVDVANRRFPKTSESMNSRNEAVVQAELERYMFEVKEIILKNNDFLEKTAEALMEKRTLLASDIKRIIENTATITKL